MRFIDLEEVVIQLPAGWAATAEKHRHKCTDLSVQARKVFIEGKASVWKGLKDVLRARSANKCWYCETRYSRADMAVDHYRPKNRIRGCAREEGYWWLAFQWENYRLACTFCNSGHREGETNGGKGDQFPIFVEEKRGNPTAPCADLDREEEPVLLDPTKFDDVRLLTFDVGTGQAVPAVQEDVDANAHKRAQVTIEVYHLRQERLREERLRKMREVRKLVLQAQAATRGDAVYQSAFREIVNSIRPDAQYSAAARTMLNSLRGVAVADKILERE